MTLQYWLGLWRTLRAALRVVEDGLAFVRVDLVVEYLRRVALADNVEGLLHVLEYNLATLLESSDLYLYDLTDASLVVAEVFYALIVFDHTGYAEV